MAHNKNKKLSQNFKGVAERQPLSFYQIEQLKVYNTEIALKEEIKYYLNKIKYKPKG